MTNHARLAINCQALKWTSRLVQRAVDFVLFQMDQANCAGERLRFNHGDTETLSKNPLKTP